MRNFQLILRHDGTLGMPGGRMDPGESRAETIKREMREEIAFEPSGE